MCKNVQESWEHFMTDKLDTEGNKQLHTMQARGSHSSVAEDTSLLGCDTVPLQSELQSTTYNSNFQMPLAYLMYNTNINTIYISNSQVPLA